MKNIFLNRLVFCLVFFLSIGCSSDSENLTSDKNYSKSTVNFFNSYYNIEYEFGESIEVKDDINNYIINEIIDVSNSSVTGIVILEKSTKKMLYFADLNSNDKEIIAIDFIQNETVILKNIKTNKNRQDFFKDDFILEIEQNNLNNKRVWGWSCGPTFSLEEDSCFRTCCYNVLWVPADCDVFTCSNLPGSNPALP